MYYGEIKNCDIANGEGVRVTLFVSGCTNHCKNCFQPQTWDFCYGQPFTTETEDYLLSLLSPVYINGLTLLGGEPFEPENQRALVPFLRRVRQMYPDKTIWGFSGFTYEELTSDGTHPRCEVTDEMLSLLDVLVDGRFVEELKDLTLRFRGSSNQRLIDLNASRQAGCLCFLPDRPGAAAEQQPPTRFFRGAPPFGVGRLLLFRCLPNFKGRPVEILADCFLTFASLLTKI